MGIDNDLASRQEEMRERWADKRRHPKSWRLISSDAGELTDINKVLNKGVRCRICRKNVARVSKRTGEIMPCNSCRNKKYLAKLAA
jgi:hypothetical protein